MISRSLGPEFGGAIGLMFTLANSIAVAMYTIGFAESLLDMCEAYIPGWTGIVDHDFTVFRTNDVRIIGCATIVLILVLAMVGMDWVTRVQKLLLVRHQRGTLNVLQRNSVPPRLWAAGEGHTSTVVSRRAAAHVGGMVLMCSCM